MRTALITLSLVLFGVVAGAAEISKQCKVDRLDLNNTDWGTVSPRIHLKCQQAFMVSVEYIDFHYTSRRTQDLLLKSLVVGEVITFKIRTNASLMYQYPDVVINVSSSRINLSVDPNEMLMFIQR